MSNNKKPGKTSGSTPPVAVVVAAGKDVPDTTAAEALPVVEGEALSQGTTEGSTEGNTENTTPAWEDTAAENTATNATSEEAPKEPIQPEEKIVELIPIVEEPAKATMIQPDAVRTTTVFVSRHGNHAQASTLDFLDRVRQSGTDIQKRALASIEKLTGMIRPKSVIEPSVFVQEQREFLRSLLWAMELPFEDFKSAWNVFQKYFQAYHDVDGIYGRNTPKEYTALSEYRLYQTNALQWKNRLPEYEAFKQITTVLRATRNPETRKQEAKLTNFDGLIDGRYITEVHVNNLKQYYDV